LGITFYAVKVRSGCTNANKTLINSFSLIGSTHQAASGAIGPLSLLSVVIILLLDLKICA